MFDKIFSHWFSAKKALPYNAVDHTHDWKQHDNGDAYCPICGFWKSQLEFLKLVVGVEPSDSE